MLQKIYEGYTLKVPKNAFVFGPMLFKGKHNALKEHFMPCSEGIFCLCSQVRA